MVEIRSILLVPPFQHKSLARSKPDGIHMDTTCTINFSMPIDLLNLVQLYIQSAVLAGVGPYSCI